MMKRSYVKNFAPKIIQSCIIYAKWQCARNLLNRFRRSKSVGYQLLYDQQLMSFFFFFLILFYLDDHVIDGVINCEEKWAKNCPNLCYCRLNTPLPTITLFKMT